MKKQFIVFGISLVIVTIVIIGATILSKNVQTEIKNPQPLIIENQTNLKITNENTSINSTHTISEKEITDTLREIEQVKNNSTYTPAPREWITSGPLQIDRTKYVLGEKIFMRFGGVSPTEKGQIVFLRPLNDTHYSVYLSVPFDGVSKNYFNLYFEPKLSKANKICDKNDLIGKWAVVLRGTEYPNLYFNLVDQIIPGDEESFKPVC